MMKMIMTTTTTITMKKYKEVTERKQTDNDQLFLVNAKHKIRAKPHRRRISVSRNKKNNTDKNNILLGRTQQDAAKK